MVILHCVIVDPQFSHVFPLDGMTRFLFEKSIFFENCLKLPLIFVLFLKRKTK